MRIAPLLALLLTSCGGSSSETPPPLEPDPTSHRYTGPRLPSAQGDAPVESAPEIDEDDLPPEQRKKPAAGTWGSGKPARSAAPAPAASASPAAPAATVPPAPAPSSPAPPPSKN